jgi:hypothetical protein
MGIICDIHAYTPDDIYIMELNESDHINKITLRTFMYGRHYVWVVSYKREMELFGPEVFRSRTERLQVAIDKYLKNDMKYHLYNYNCEYFVRMCVFNQERLWKSSQTVGVFESSFFVGLNLIAIGITHLIDNAVALFDYEKDSPDRKDDTRYHVHSDSIDSSQ